MTPTEQQAVTFCRDCAHQIGSGENSLCGKDPYRTAEPKVVSWVTGKVKNLDRKFYYHCTTTRRYDQPGPVCSWFDPKPPKAPGLLTWLLRRLYGESPR